METLGESEDYNDFVAPETGDSRAEIGDILSHEFEDQQSPQAVFVLSGGITKDSQSDKRQENSYGYGGYKSLSYKDVDLHGFVTGGKARVFAAAEVAKMFPELTIVTTSMEKSDRPSHASVQAAELEQRGVPSEQILREEISVNTATELTELVKLAVAHQWTRIAAITSDYHIPRCQAMWEMLDSIITYEDPEFREALVKFNDNGGQLSFVAAESILEMVSSKYARLFEEVRKSDSFVGRLDAEARGQQDLRDGKYKIWSKPSEHPNPNI